MPAMYSFCFWFSVRLGSIIVGAISLCQALGFLILCCIGLQDQPAVTAQFKTWLDNNNVLFLNGVMMDMRDNPATFLTIFTTYMAIYAFSCLLLMYGAYTCNLLMMYLFMGMDLFRLVFLSINFVFAMLLVKKNIYNLGLLIGCSVAGGFLLLYLFYLWFCTLSMCQIVKELEQVEDLGPLQQPASVSASIYPQKEPLEMGIGMGFYSNGYGAMSRPIF